MNKHLMDIPKKLESDHLIVRSYEEGNGEALFELVNEDREYLKPHVNYVNRVTDVEHAETVVRELIADWTSRKRFVMGIWEKSNSTKLVGEIWIEAKNWDLPLFELGWYLASRYQGKGIATEAVKMSLKFLFENLNAHKVEVLTRENNIKSAKLAERCGFIREGLLRGRVKTEDAIIIGSLRYGMLKSEYDDLKNSY